MAFTSSGRYAASFPKGDASLRLLPPSLREMEKERLPSLHWGERLGVWSLENELPPVLRATSFTYKEASKQQQSLTVHSTALRDTHKSGSALNTPAQPHNGKNVFSFCQVFFPESGMATFRRMTSRPSSL